jgi:hypothetical protein
MFGNLGWSRRIHLDCEGLVPDPLHWPEYADRERLGTDKFDRDRVVHCAIDALTRHGARWLEATPPDWHLTYSGQGRRG